MTQINLLPWRETRIRELDTRYYTMAGIGLLLTLAIMVTIQFGLIMLRTNQAERNHFLQTNLDQLSHLARQAETLKKTLETRQNTLDKLVSIQHFRLDSVALMRALANRIPAPVYLTEWVEMNPHQTISGWAQSETAVADFLHELGTTPHIHRAELTTLENDPKGSSHPYGTRFWIKLTTNLDAADIPPDKASIKPHNTTPHQP